MKTIDLMNELLNRIDKIAIAADHAKSGLRELAMVLQGLSDDPKPAGEIELLTERQRAVFDLLSEKLDTPEIAKRLNISERTVETHRNTMRIRFKFKTVAEFKEFAINHRKGLNEKGY